jgi:hypothetical protein
MAKKHEHDWITLSFVFPEDGEASANYEYDEPYEILYCACGERKTTSMSEDLISEVRAFNQLPPEEIKKEDS